MSVEPTTVVVISPSGVLGAALSKALGRHEFAVVEVRPGRAVLDAARREQPGIAVIDGIDQRPGAAELEIALLKALSPGVRIIAVAQSSSDADAAVIEQGVFYYAADATDLDLVRVIRAARPEALEGRNCRP